MTTRKKKKKKLPPASIPILAQFPTKGEIENRIVTIKKIIKVIGLDPDLFDSFTKKQKQLLLLYKVNPPRIVASKDCRVPKAFINFIHKNVYHFYNTIYLYGDPSTELTLMDVLTTGMSFMMSLEAEIDEPTMPPDKIEIVKKIWDRMEELDFVYGKDGIDKAVMMVEYMTMMLTQMNYRIYGFTCDYAAMNSYTGLMGICITVETKENEYVYFTHNGLKRKGYRVAIGKGNYFDFTYAKLKYQDIYPGVKSEKTLPVYIQTHALHRFKERLNLIDPSSRNLYILGSIHLHPKMVIGPEGQRLLECSTGKDFALGYFTYVVQDETVFITTLLPLTSPETPEGKKLTQILGLNIEDMAYLGMDKMSFYFEIDLNEIPALKDALITSGILRCMELFKKDLPRELKIDAKKTAFVKKYFETGNNDGNDNEHSEEM